MSVSTELVDEPPFSIRRATAPGVEAVKHNWAPFLLIQAFAAALVISYYRYPALQQVTESLQKLKESTGFRFDLVSGSLSGGVLPQVAKVVTRKVRRIDGAFWKDTAYHMAIYASLAVLVDYFYQFQGVLFGSGIDLPTLAKKNVVDMFVFSPFLCMPLAVAMFESRKARFSGAALLGTLKTRFYRDKMMPVLIPAWTFWIPMLFCVYAMPPDLQFPLSQLASASWCLIFIFIATA